jgi:L-lactate dehydrogenase complex protein LldG
MPSSRDAILQAIKQNQPERVALPQVPTFTPYFDDPLQKYITVLSGIGGQVYQVKNYDEIAEYIKQDFAGVKRIVSFDKVVSHIAEIQDGTKTLHQFEDVDVCIIHANLAVAENGAVWINETNVPERVLPFITQSLVVVISASSIVPTMHDAYKKIGDIDYGFATFIAGPSKTADIEQSLVLGAHGPKSMVAFILE